MTTYYVDPGGDDGDPGTESQPWQTPDKAFATLAAGDTAIFEDGTYPTHNVTPTNSGTSGNAITYRSRHEGQAIFQLDQNASYILSIDRDYITLDGFVFDGNYDWSVPSGYTASHLIYVTDSDNLTIQNCQIESAYMFGIRCLNSVTNITIDNVEIDLNTEWSITNDGADGIVFDQTGNSGITITDCVVYHTGHVGINMKSGSNVLIENCVVHTTGSHNISVSADLAMDDVVIKDCTVHDAGYFSEEAQRSQQKGYRFTADDAGLLTNVQLKNCVAYHCWGAGLYIDGCTDGPFEIWNNVFDDNDQRTEAGRTGQTGQIYMWEGACGDNQSPDIEIRNCIVYSTVTDADGYAMFVSDNIDNNLDMDYNLWFAPSGAAEKIRRKTTTYADFADYDASGREPHSLFSQDPQFVDRDNADYHLLGTSPAIDAGVNVGLPYNGSAPDIGAFESGDISIDAIASAETFGAPLVSSGQAVIIPLGGVLSGEAFGSPSVSGGVTPGGDVSVGIVRQAASTATGNQDFTVSGLGSSDDIKGALFVITRATSDGVAAAHANIGIGAATGASNQWCISSTDEDAQPSTDSGERTNSDVCIQILNPGAVAVDGEATFVSTITDGVRVNWTDAPASAYLVTALIVAGSDVSAHANWKALGDTKDAAVDVADPGFQPEQLIVACRDVLGDSGSGANVRLSVGAVYFGDSVAQRSYCQRSLDGQPSSEVLNRYTETYGAMAVLDNGNLDWGAEFSDPDSDGFTVTPRNNGANDTALFYLALSFGGTVEANLVTINSPTATGNDSPTGPGHKPQAVVLGLTHAEAADTTYDDGRGGVYGLGAFTENDEYCNALAIEDGQETSDTQSLSDDTAINLPQDDGSVGHVATLVSLDDNGWTWNFSATLGTSKKWWALTIGIPSQQIAPTSIASVEAFGSAEVDLIVQPDGISSEEAHGTVKITLNVVATGVGSGETFGSPSLSLFVTTAGVASAETFGTATLALYTTPSGITTAETFGSPALSLTISANGVASAETFGSPSLALFALSSGVASAEAFGSTSIVLTVAATGIVSAEAFGAATLALGATFVTPGGLESSETFGAAIVSTVGTVYPTGLISLEAFGAATLSPGAVTVELTGVASAEAFGTARLTLYVLAAGIASAETFGAATLALGAVSVAPGSITSLETFGAAALGLYVVPAGVASGETFGTAALLLSLAATGVASLETFGSHTLAPGAVTVQPVGLASLETFGSHALDLGAVTVYPDGVVSAEAFGSVALLLIIAAASIGSEEAFGSTRLRYADFIIHAMAQPRGFSAAVGERHTTMKAPPR